MAPDWTRTLGASFETDISTNQSIFIALDALYSDSYLPSGFGQELSRISSYVTLDGTVQLRSRKRLGACSGGQELDQ